MDPELQFTGITHIAIDKDNGRARANLIKVSPTRVTGEAQEIGDSASNPRKGKQKQALKLRF